MSTRTGQFPIGFRQGGSSWQKDSLPALISWAKATGFESLDLQAATLSDLSTLKQSGLRLGSLDLLEMGKLVDSEPAARKELVARNVEHVKSLAAAGVKNFFTVIIGDKTKSRRENYPIAVESFGPIASALEQAGAKLVIEGWPGPSPTFPALCCTPETCRNFIKDVNPRSVGINYDPSHLIRLGIDHIRFLREFAPHIYHVHAKDTELMPDAVYEFGLFQESTFTQNPPYTASTWRYTIPGHGQTRWTEVFRFLHEIKYDGVVSVELEDKNFHGSEAAEKAGLLHSLLYLSGT